MSLSDFRWGRAASIAEKEIYHILRDPFTLAVALVLPVVMVVVFGLAIEFNVKNIKLTVLDQDKTQSSRQLAEVFGSSNYFLLNKGLEPTQTLHKLDSEQARATLIISERFEKDLLSGRQAQAQIILDGSDNSTVGPILGYLNGINSNAVTRLLHREAAPPTVDLRTRFLFNPELNSSWFIVPGLAVTVMSILSVLLTALTVAREWENGSMELLLSTPVQPLEIIIGKLAPYTALGLGALTFVYLMARLGFGVPFHGSHVILIFGALLFLACYLAQGLFISLSTRKQQIAMQIALMSGMLPSMLLSGFIFPIENMPKFFQVLTAIFPARWFMRISRGEYLEGASFYNLRYDFLALACIGTVLISLALKNFKRDVEP